MRTREQAKMIAQKIMSERYPDALLGLCAGSIVRGQGTETSDIDLVVIYTHLKNGFRESFTFEGWPVEVFVHDFETLNYFFELDSNDGTPSLQQMVVESLVVHGSQDEAQKVKDLASKIIQSGPPSLTEDDIKNRLYGITDLVDDLKSHRSRVEGIGIVNRLYEQLGHFILRSQNDWSGNGKQLSRAMEKYLPDQGQEFNEAFEDFFKNNQSQKILILADKIVSKHGGYLFDGYRREAPKGWRRPVDFEQNRTSREFQVREGYSESWIEQLMSLHNKTELRRGEGAKLRVNNGFKNSFAVATVWLENRLIGCGRMISDGQMYSGIYDVVVDPEFQRHGLGKRIVQNLISKAPQTCIFLTSTFGNEKFYGSLGFRKHKSALALYPEAMQSSPYLGDFP